MSKLYIGDANNRAKLVTDVYAGDENNIARKVKAIFKGNRYGIADKIWEAEKEISDEYSVLITTYANEPADNTNPVYIVPNDTLSYTTNYGIEFKDLNAQNSVWTPLTEATKLMFNWEHKINVRVRGTCLEPRLRDISYGPVFNLQTANESNTTYRISGAAETLVDYTSVANGNGLSEDQAAFHELFYDCVWLGDASDLWIGNYTPMYVGTGNGGCQNMFNGCSGLVNGPYVVFQSANSSPYWCDHMFSGCTSLTRIGSNCYRLSSAGDHCFDSMFYGCTSLTKTPELAATLLNGYCYINMFHGCTSLTEAPELPATSLGEHCYDSMFYGCTSLTKTPELPATKLRDGAYQNMFYGCTSLTTVSDILAETIYDGSCQQMFYGCTAITYLPTGLFENVRSIPQSGCEGMFYKCYSLPSLNDGFFSKVESIGPYGCRNMFNNCYKALKELPDDFLAATTTIDHHACIRMFGYCSALTNLEKTKMLNNVTTIGDHGCDGMLYYCYNLEDAPRLANVTDIGKYGLCEMFYYCKGLTDVSGFFPTDHAVNFSKSAGSKVFSNCSYLVTVDSPIFAHAGTIGDGAFTSMFEKCGNLKFPPVIVLDSLLDGDGSATGTPFYSYATDVQESEFSSYTSYWLKSGKNDVSGIPVAPFPLLLGVTGATMAAGMRPSPGLSVDPVLTGQIDYGLYPTADIIDVTQIGEFHLYGYELISGAVTNGGIELLSTGAAWEGSCISAILLQEIVVDDTATYKYIGHASWIAKSDGSNTVVIPFSEMCLDSTVIADLEAGNTTLQDQNIVVRLVLGYRPVIDGLFVKVYYFVGNMIDSQS